MGRVVPIKTPLTQEVSAFVGTLQSKGSAVVRVDEPQLFRQAVRVEALRRGVRVRTGIASEGFEYVRRGTLSLYAALNTRTGEVMGKTVASHTSEEFVAFLAAVVASRPQEDDIHVILDNLSAHKTKRVEEFLGLHPNVRLHFTPTYSSWLNQVEIWLGKIERDVIARGIFTSTTDLNRKLMRYIREHNKRAKPIKWRYTDVTHRLRAPHSSVTVH